MPKYKDKDKSEGESKPDYSKGNSSREANEMAEGEKTIVNNTAPNTRYQTQQQVTEVAEASKIETPKSSFIKKASEGKGSQLKQEVASKLLLADSDYGGATTSVASPTRSGLKSLSYSGDAGTILGTAANTPVVGEPNRSSGRFEKKLDATIKKINFLANEQVLSSYDNPKPLGDSGSEKQGYYGTPKNNSVRSQKSAGGTPANLLVERSADEITVDKLVFVEGQYIKDASVAINDVEPTISTEFVNGIRTEIPLTASGDEIVYDNYLNRAVRVGVTRKDGKCYIDRMQYDTVKATCPSSPAIVNSSSTAWVRGMNADEISRQLIDSKAGRETQIEWSPLGRGVRQPTQTVGLLRRLEADTGANYVLSYKFASKAHAYQLNKAAKDGQRISTPMNEMLLGSITGNMSSADFTTGAYFNGLNPFSPQAYRLGAASLAIAMYDSVSKYATKGDVLTAPRSLRRAFQVADNNMNIFRVPADFVAALNNVDVFSTIDRDYDPLLPVCITDRVALLSAISYERFGSFTRESAGAPRVYEHQLFRYAYSNRSSNYTVTVKHPLLEGIADLFDSLADKLYEVCQDPSDKYRDGSITIDIPIMSCTKCFSLWDFVVLYATPFVQKARINTERDILDFEVNFEYPFKLLDIKTVNPRNAVNYNIVDIDSPLEVRRMIPSTAITWILPEFFWGVSGTLGTNETRMVYPWYFSNLQFDSTVGDDSSGSVTPTQKFMSGVMSIPVIRSGVRLGLLDDIYSMSERDLRLCLDRITTTVADGQDTNKKYMVYKYGQANDGIPAFEETMTILNYISAPRELGMFMNAPHGLLRVMDNKSDVINGYAGFAGYVLDDDIITTSFDHSYVFGDTSFRLYCWKGVTQVNTNILAVDDVNISRAQAFRQYWDCSPACYMKAVGESAGGGYRPRLEVGFFTGLRQCFGSINGAALGAKTNCAYFKPFTTGIGSEQGNAEPQLTGSDNYVIAFHKGLWGRLQKLPMVISPWDTCDFDGDTGANYDPYDFAYMFNMAGVMASDYNQDLYDRANQVQQQGWLFTVDPFIQESPVFKDSIKYTM